MFGTKKKRAGENESSATTDSHRGETEEPIENAGKLKSLRRRNTLTNRKKMLLVGLLAVFTLGAFGAALKSPGGGQGVLSRIGESVGLTAKTENSAVDSSALNPTLQLSKEYIYAGSRMLAIEDYGVSGASQPSSPSTPAAPTLNVISQTQIDVYWNASPASENVASYKLRINGHYIISGITYLSYPATGLAPGTNYTFEVAAVNSSGVSSAWSPGASATTQSDAPAPSVPTGVVTQTYSSTQVNVFWDAAPSGETIASYNLRVGGGQVFPGITYLSFPVTGLTPNTTYTFEVQAVSSAGGVSNWSSPVSGATAQPPTAPSIEQVDVISSSQINVYWSGAQAGETIAGYNVRMNGSQVLTGFTYQSFPFGGLSPNTTYTFEVQAVDSAGGGSAWSPSQSATTYP